MIVFRVKIHPNATLRRTHSLLRFSYVGLGNSTRATARMYSTSLHLVSSHVVGFEGSCAYMLTVALQQRLLARQKSFVQLWKVTRPSLTVGPPAIGMLWRRLSLQKHARWTKQHEA